MDGSKPWWESQTVWANILQVITPMFLAWHLITPDQAQVIVDKGPAEIGLIVMACLGMWGIVGRIKATKKVELT